MRAHHDVNRSFFQTEHGSFDLLGRAKTAHLGDLHRPLGKAVGQGLKMLFCKQGGGCQDGDLLATHHRNKRGTQRHLGFAKTHIATNKAVHGAGADHVLNDGVDCASLVGGFFKAKVVGKHLVVLWGVAKRVALSGSTPRIDIEQLGRRVSDLFGGTALGLVPLA